jgi:alpha-methylacyl-CoA racemase
MTEAAADPHLAARGTFATTGGLVQPAPAPRFDRAADGSPIDALPAGPIEPVGAHTRAVLTDYGFADVDELLSAGAAWQA